MPDVAEPVSSPNAPQHDVPAGLLAAVSLSHYGGAVAAVYQQLSFDWDGVLEYLNACVSAHPRVTYGLGAKIPGVDSIPGKDFTKVDCSGFVRMLVLKFATPHLGFPDGSVVQHDWVASHGFEPSSVEDAKRQDGKVRIAFLRPQDTSEHIGHVVLIRNAMTVESHGHVGPDSRTWDGTAWQGRTYVYILGD